MAASDSVDSGLDVIDGDSNEQLKLCVVGETLLHDKVLLESLKVINIPVTFCNSVSELNCCDKDSAVAYVFDSFDSADFRLIYNKNKRIYGPTIIKQCAENDRLLPMKSRPLYCESMENLVICFTGFSDKEEMQEMVKLVHNMGGGIRKELKVNVTHLIANRQTANKYKYAVSLGTVVMKSEWIYQCWEKRNDKTFTANDSDLIKEYKQKPFFSCRIAFVGFNEDDKKEMEKLTEEHGGTVTSLDTQLATHVVVDEQNEVDLNLLDEIEISAYVVRAEWFWASIQMDACPQEKMYRYQSLIGSPPARSTTPFSSSLTPLSKQCKRKRLKRKLGHLAQVPEVDQRRQSLDILGKSMNGSLDATLSPEKNSPNNSPEPLGAVCLSPPPPAIKSQVELKNLSGRQQVCLELLHTERNYIGILETIMITFKAELDRHEDSKDPLLPPTEKKIIFGNIPPIFEVHKKFLEDLTSLMNNWKEDCSLGSVILSHASDILKAYTAFVNYFEETKEKLVHCDKTNQRFHAFLKVCQSKPECGRQSLSELLIRPVQRLPSIILLLNDILKHTNKSNSDYPHLEEAIAKFKEVLTNINENKRKTEGQVEMFTTIKHIDNCPPNLLSSHRSFVCKVDVMELSGSIGAKGDTLTIFLFSDMIEICKKRIKLLGTMKSPNTSSLLGNKSNVKLYKHLELMPLAHIKRIVDITETEECKNVFGLIFRSNQELVEKLLSFTLVNTDDDKVEFLRKLSRQVANSVCRNDVENFITVVPPHELDIETSEVNTNSLSRAVSRFAHRTSRNLSRALSFNRTPNTLKRAMSSIISPFQAPMQLNDNHLARSSVDLQVVDVPSTSRSAKVSKKVKASSFGPSSSKLL